jgi:hypothetical protein
VIANSTTLILGAGASAPVYPTGVELRKKIISGFGAEAYEQYLKSSLRHEDEEEMALYDGLRRRFNASHIVSIDFFGWINEPHAQARTPARQIMHIFQAGRLPYVR